MSQPTRHPVAAKDSARQEIHRSVPHSGKGSNAYMLFPVEY
ncbi:kynurenine aminotransferase [Moniliophthora roreri]|nr:kynurenine aminotransferase [Moniliophthora roreri]